MDSGLCVRLRIIAFWARAAPGNSVYATPSRNKPERFDLSGSFQSRVPLYTARITAVLEAALPAAAADPSRLHEAMRYAALNGGKRLRPLIVYAAGECLAVDPALLDAPAAAIELIHAFSLVHDDLPAMDNDDLRRGLPTLHRQYDEATAILAADALQPLAFATLVNASPTSAKQKAELVSLIANASGSFGMTGGQSIDLLSEGKQLSPQELEVMYAMKTGALIHASVMSACCVVGTLSSRERDALDIFGRSIGVAFQIKDDILDVEGETDVIGKPQGSDIQKNKATYPALLGLERSRQRCEELLNRGLDALEIFDEGADALRWLARYVVERGS